MKRSGEQPQARFELVRKLTPEQQEVAALQHELRALRRSLLEREAQLHAMRSQLISFEGRYLRQVGLLLRKLDGWEQKITALHTRPWEETEAEEAVDDADDTVPDPTRLQEAPRAMRELFRALARRIHPDFARDVADTAKRTLLMAQANDAYLRGDRQGLERMLRGFEEPRVRTQEAALREDLEQTRFEMQQIHSDIAAADADIAALQISDTAKLQERTIAAAVEGRDLLAEMARQVTGRIGMAMRQYELDVDRIKRPGKGRRMEDLLTAEEPVVPPTFKRFR